MQERTWSSRQRTHTFCTASAVRPRTDWQVPIIGRIDSSRIPNQVDSRSRGDLTHRPVHSTFLVSFRTRTRTLWSDYKARRRILRSLPASIWIRNRARPFPFQLPLQSRRQRIRTSIVRIPPLTTTGLLAFKSLGRRRMDRIRNDTSIT